MHIDESRLENFIIDAGLISEDEMAELKKSAQEKGGRIGSLAVTKGIMTDEDLRRMEAYLLGVPFVDLKNRKIDFSVLSLIPEPIARHHNIVAFGKGPESLEVAMLDTGDFESIDFLKKKLSLKLLPRLTDGESMKWALLSYQKTLKAEFGDRIQHDAGQMRVPHGTGKGISEEELKKLAANPSAIGIVDTLLKHALVQGGTDIHIEPEEAQILVRYRIHGLLRDAMILPKHTMQSIAARIKMLANLNLLEQGPQEGRFKIDAEGERVSLSVSTLSTVHGEKIVIRLLPEHASGFALETLGFHGQGLEDLHSALKLSTGMILVAGSQNSGKTTTLYTLVDLINAPDLNISTIEETVEYQMPRVNQVEAKPKGSLSYTNGLRALLRQDPDVIMVSDIRDAETASLTIHASLSGHVVLAALVASSAPGALASLLKMKVEPLVLASTVCIVVAQRLVKKLAGEKISYFLTKNDLKSLGSVIALDRMLDILKRENIVPQKATWEEVPFYKSKTGSEENAGYVGIQEVLRVSPAIKELLLKESSPLLLEAQAMSEGMLTMAEDGIFKAVQGLTTLEEALRIVSE